jgi:hypothetical protein
MIGRFAEIVKVKNLPLKRRSFVNKLNHLVLPNFRKDEIIQ